MVEGGINQKLLLVARKGGFGLPIACPSCLPVYLYLKFANASFDIEFDTSNPDSDHIPYVEYGDYVAYNNEKGGLIQSLKEDEIVDLDSKLAVQTVPELQSLVAMVDSWLLEALQYELWVSSDGHAADFIYFSDLSWPIRKALHWKQTQAMKTLLRITKNRVANRDDEIHRNAAKAYDALSFKLGDQRFFLDDRPTSLDALCAGHFLFVLHALPEMSSLRSSLSRHENLVKYAENVKMEYLEASSSSSSSSVPRSPFDASTSSYPQRRGSSKWNSKPKEKTKKEKTPEEKKFRSRAKFFVAAQFIAILVFLSIMGGADMGEIDDGEEDGAAYED